VPRELMAHKHRDRMSILGRNIKAFQQEFDLIKSLADTPADTATARLNRERYDKASQAMHRFETLKDLVTRDYTLQEMHTVTGIPPSTICAMLRKGYRPMVYTRKHERMAHLDEAHPDLGYAEGILRRGFFEPHGAYHLKVSEPGDWPLVDEARRAYEAFTGEKIRLEVSRGKRGKEVSHGFKIKNPRALRMLADLKKAGRDPSLMTTEQEDRFLQGLFDEGGSLKQTPTKRRNADGTQALESLLQLQRHDREPLEKAQKLLAERGIIAQLKWVPAVNAHRLYINGQRNFRRFADRIGFRVPSKQEKFESLLAVPERQTDYTHDDYFGYRYFRNLPENRPRSNADVAREFDLGSNSSPWLKDDLKAKSNNARKYDELMMPELVEAHNKKNLKNKIKPGSVEARKLVEQHWQKEFKERKELADSLFESTASMHPQVEGLVWFPHHGVTDQLRDNLLLQRGVASAMSQAKPERAESLKERLADLKAKANRLREVQYILRSGPDDRLGKKLHRDRLEKGIVSTLSAVRSGEPATAQMSQINRRIKTLGQSLRGAAKGDKAAIKEQLGILENMLKKPSEEFKAEQAKLAKEKETSRQEQAEKRAERLARKTAEEDRAVLAAQRLTLLKERHRLRKGPAHARL